MIKDYKSYNQSRLSKRREYHTVTGKNVYIGPGAVIYGDIEIADNCYIGANAVVNKSVTEPYSVIAGVPAKLVRIEERAWNEK